MLSQVIQRSVLCGSWRRCLRIGSFLPNTQFQWKRRFSLELNDEITTILAKEVRTRDHISYEGKIVQVASISRTQQGRGTCALILECTNVGGSGKVTIRTKTDAKLEKTQTRGLDLQYLYRDGDLLHFMDPLTYEQHEVPLDDNFKSALPFIEEGRMTQLAIVQNTITGINFPQNDCVLLTIAETDNNDPNSKNAKLATGLEVAVPGHSKTGMTVKYNFVKNLVLEVQKTSE